MKRFAFFSLLIFGASNLSVGLAGEKAPSAEALRFFENKVRPILAENCQNCHGEKKQRGSLRVDSRFALLEGGEVGPAIVVGDPEKSLLIKAVRHTDRDLKMPPEKKLTREQIDVLATWIRMGAPWPGSDKAPPPVAKKGEFTISDKDRAHWAFQPIRRPLAPAVKAKEWVKSPIDAFIAHGLEGKGLIPNPPAERVQLLRRVTYGLTGLPPTGNEIEDFLRDGSPDAYAKLVDRLLASPRYGEKWGRHWLDLVRYAETNSYERDNPKPNVWRYRDYVISAFNSDKPFDLFIKEQIAGDEMGRKDPDAIIATGYYRLGIWDDEPVDPLQARYDMLDDIVVTTGQAFLGLTLDCARCHNHKIDPIPQKDYYRFLSFFHNINHYRNGGPTDEKEIYGSDEMRAKVEQTLKQAEAERGRVAAEIAAIEKEFRAKADNKSAGDKLAGNDLQGLHYRFYRGAWQKLPDFDNLKFEDEGTLPKNLFDISPRTRDTEIGFVFEGFLVAPESGTYRFHLDSDDGSRLTISGKKVLEYDGIHGTGKEKSVQVNLEKGRHPIRLDYFQNIFGFGLEVAWSGPGFERRTLSVSQNRSTVRDFKVAIQTDGPALLGKAKYQEYLGLKKRFASLEQRKIPVDRALCVTETGQNPPDTFVFVRGNPQVKGDKVTPGFPAVLNLPDPGTIKSNSNANSTGRRTILANWLVNRDNPLTARVFVNRVWQQHFGRGIVRTPNDFGLQGAKPTHPELLDWLASELMENGWSMKKLHRTILLSNAYQMASKGNAEGMAKDQPNDLFWRFDMRRLSAEEVRDSILAVSGNLNLKMAGPGIFPEIPREVLEGQSVPGRGWTVSPPEEQARRSVYVHVKRSLVLPIFESFDIAETDRTTPTRFSTTQPTQALLLLNSDFIHRQAGIFANRLRKAAPESVTEQIRQGLYLTTNRMPGAAEVDRGLRFLERLQRDDNVTSDQALHTFCLLMLNMNEFLYLD